MKQSKYALYLSFLAVTLLTVFSHKLPFFWDGTFFSELASGFYSGSFGPFDCPHNLDNVTFPVYSTYLFIAWKIFSKSLLVSHLAMLPFLIGICYEFYRLSKKFLDDRFVSFAMLLLLLEPTFMTQGIIMGYDVLLVYLFLLALRLILDDKKQAYAFIISLLALYSIRGLFLAFSLSVLQLILLYPEHRIRSFFLVAKQHLICLLLVITWFAYHKMQTGWFIISPIHENTDEKLVPFSMMIRQAIFIGWKIADFGRIFLWLVFIGGFFILWRRKNIPVKLRLLLRILFIPLIISSAFMILFSNPVGHRYFIFSFLALILGTCYVLQEVASALYRNILLVILFIGSLSGNFWIYPERFGNGWDASLKVLPYFELKEEMDGFIKESGIHPEEIGTQYPMIADKRFSHLSEIPFAYTNVWRGPLSNYHYYLQSNVINTDIPGQTEEVKKKWVLLKELRSGQVYISLYKNPAFSWPKSAGL